MDTTGSKVNVDELKRYVEIWAPEKHEIFVSRPKDLLDMDRFDSVKQYLQTFCSDYREVH